MKIQKRAISATLMLALFAGSAGAVSAYQKTITVNYGTSLTLNRNSVTLTDVNGNVVQPFTYNGTTYVPLRAVSVNFGMTTSYDASTKSIDINNDALQACGLLHKMEYTANFINRVTSVMNDCFLVNTVETSSFKIECTGIDDMYNDAMEYENTLSSIDNMYIEQIESNAIPEFKNLYTSFKKLQTQYELYRSSPSELFKNSFDTYYTEIALNLCDHYIDKCYQE